MTRSEINTIRRALFLLAPLIGESRGSAPKPTPSPLRGFVEQYLVADADSDMSCQEMWRFFQEVVAAGELAPVPKAVFLRELPALIEEVFHTRKSHHLWREGRQVRGFRGVGIKMDGCDGVDL